MFVACIMRLETMIPRINMLKFDNYIQKQLARVEDIHNENSKNIEIFKRII